MAAQTITFRIRELDPDLIAPPTRNMNKPEQGGSKIVIIGKPGCFAPGTMVMMADGLTKKVESVKVGDQVMGDDSRPRTVLELCQGTERMYRINYLTGGDSYIVNEKHSLVLKKGKTIVEIPVEEYLKKDDEWKVGYHIYRTAVDFPEQPTQYSPYEFGRMISMMDSQRIPSEYIYNSRENRIALLKGFFKENGALYEWKNSETRRQIDFIRKTLGTYWNEFECECTIDSLGEGDYYGFTLDGNHRFLLAGCDVVRNTGKTTLITSLLHEKSHIFPVGQVMCGTEDSNGHYGKIFPSTFVYNSLDKTKIEDFVRRQKIAKQHLPNPWSILLLDDCTDDPKIFSDPMFQGIFKNGRHWKMLFILSLQYGLDIKPVIRTNVDGTFILRESNLRNRRCLWENYAGVFPDFDQFCQVLDQITDDYTALYVHNATTSNKIEDCVFWYKARPIPPEFRIGSQDYWEFHTERYDESKDKTL